MAGTSRLQSQFGKAHGSSLQKGMALLTAPPESTGAASILIFYVISQPLPAVVALAYLFPVSDRQHPHSKDAGQHIT